MSTHVVFDAYGTLLDVDSTIRRCDPQGVLPENFSALWRAKQLEYTWVLQTMGAYRDFESLTAEALDFTIQALRAGSALRAELLSGYRRLDPFPEVEEALRALSARGFGLSVLSNGTAAMLEGALSAAGIDGYFEAIVSVDEIGVFKPDQRVYRHALERLDTAASSVWFVSANAWDAAGADRFGFRIVRVNRAGAPDEYGLAAGVTTLPDLRDPLAAIATDD